MGSNDQGTLVVLHSESANLGNFKCDSICTEVQEHVHPAFSDSIALADMHILMLQENLLIHVMFVYSTVPTDRCPANAMANSWILDHQSSGYSNICAAQTSRTFYNTRTKVRLRRVWKLTSWCWARDIFVLETSSKRGAIVSGIRMLSRLLDRSGLGR